VLVHNKYKFQSPTNNMKHRDNLIISYDFYVSNHF
jgi:hypothetical protein